MVVNYLMGKNWSLRVSRLDEIGMSQIAIYLLCIKDNFSVLIRHLERVGMVHIVSISKGSSSIHHSKSSHWLPYRCNIPSWNG